MTYNSSWSELQSNPEELNMVVSEELRPPCKNSSEGTLIRGEPLRRTVPG